MDQSEVQLTLWKRFFVGAIYGVSAWCGAVALHSYYTADYPQAALGAALSFFLFDTARKFARDGAVTRYVYRNLCILTGLFYAMAVYFALCGDYFGAISNLIVAIMWTRTCRKVRDNEV